MARETDYAYEGLANLANSIRRSTALYVAMSITPAESSEADLLACFDRLAAHLAGHAEDPEPDDGPPAEGSLGVPWRNRDLDT